MCSTISSFFRVFRLQLLPATKYGRAHYRALEHACNQELRLHRYNFDAEVTWPGSCRADLEWWASLTHPVFNSFEAPRFSIHMTTGASLEG